MVEKILQWWLREQGNLKDNELPLLFNQSGSIKLKLHKMYKIKFNI